MLTYTLFTMIIIFSIEGIQIRNRKIQKLSQILIIMIFYLVAGISYRIHNDYFVYENIYREIDFSNIKYISFEKGYVVLNAIFNNYLEFYNFKSLVYLVNTFLIYKGLKKILNNQKNYMILGLLYLQFNQFYYLYLSAFRQSIAIAIFIYSLSYIRDRKLLRYTLTIFLAFFFHKSALILYPVYFIFNYRIKVKIILIIYMYIILNILILLPQIQQEIFFIFSKIINILKLETLSKSYLVKSADIGIKNMVLTLVLMFLYKYLTSKKENYFINKMLFCYIIMEILSKVFGVFSRIEIYFTTFYCIFLVELFFKCNRNIIFKFLRVSLILFIGLNYNIKSIWNKYTELGSLIPFHFIYERFYKEINNQDTAEYSHLLKRYKNKELNELREEIIRSYTKK